MYVAQCYCSYFKFKRTMSGWTLPCTQGSKKLEFYLNPMNKRLTNCASPGHVIFNCVSRQLAWVHTQQFSENEKVFPWQENLLLRESTFL